MKKQLVSMIFWSGAVIVSCGGGDQQGAQNAQGSTATSAGSASSTSASSSTATQTSSSPSAGASSQSSASATASPSAAREQVLVSVRSQAKDCYTKVLKTSPKDRGGSVKVHVSQDSKGKVRTAECSGKASDALTTCVCDLFHTATFPPPDPESMEWDTSFVFKADAK